MFGIVQKRAGRAVAKAPKLHSIAAVMRGRNFAGKFDVGGVSYEFTFVPAKAAVVGRKLQLAGSLTVIDGRPIARISRHSLDNVQATLISSQGGIGTAPPRKTLPAEISARTDLPVVESTGALSFCGVLYFKLSPLDGRALGVPAELNALQLNVRIAPVNEAERNLQGVYSSIVDACLVAQVDRHIASEQVKELNRLLATS
ncbi:MAG TPA: hypothetical protein VNS63_19960 [Blastocatellia bacterium]|nr:hypothetical protein [Blastocatellia bacterium]